MSEIRCDCGKLVATVERTTTTIGDPAEEPGVSVTGVLTGPVTVTTGARIVLADGFVPARSRHASGRPWYVRSRRAPARPGPRVRDESVATCGCGRDVVVFSYRGGRYQSYAKARRADVADIHADEVLDSWDRVESPPEWGDDQDP